MRPVQATTVAILSLSLFMFGVGADHAHNAAAMNNLAFITNLFN